MMGRYIVCCGGSQAKWKNHLGVPSHLVPDLSGEPILQNRETSPGTWSRGDRSHGARRGSPVPDRRNRVRGGPTGVNERVLGFSAPLGLGLPNCSCPG